MKIVGVIVLSLSFLVQGQSQKMVMMEKFTNSYCGACPNASLRILGIVEENPNTIWIAHHKPVDWTDNPLNNDQSIALWDDLNVPGVPYGMVNRTNVNGSILVGQNSWNNLVDSEMNTPHYASVDINEVSYNPNSRNLAFEVAVNFEELPDAEEYRLTAYMVEDSVWGQEQHSYFNDVAGHPLEGLGDIIWAYPHRNVVRTILDDHWGTQGVVPNEPIIGEVYSNTYNYEVPEDFRIDRMHIVTSLSKYDANQNERIVYNADKQNLRELDLDFTSAQKEIDPEISLSISPNPSSDFLDVETTADIQKFTIIHLDGSVSEVKNTNTHSTRLDISWLKPGLYYLVGETTKGKLVSAFTVVK